MMRMSRRAFTMVEILVVMALMGVMMTIIVPRLRVSPTQRVKIAARQMMRDAELARNRSLAMKAMTRLQFNSTANSYESFADHDRNGSISGNATERAAIRAFGLRVLTDQVIFGRGTAPNIPGESGSGAVTLTSERIEFDQRGLPIPFGTRGTVYVTSSASTSVVFAIEISGAGSMRLWEYRSGAWQ
jgi:prepilin-type N-terminal cleavage/methylation domain-containing protein